MAKDSNLDFYFLGGLGVVALGAIVVGFMSGRKSKAIEGLGRKNKSVQASSVLRLMDSDFSYREALNLVVSDYTKGQSINQKKRFKRSLEKELNNYI